MNRKLNINYKKYRIIQMNMRYFLVHNSKKEELLKDKGVSDALKKHNEDKGVTKCDTLKWGIMDKLGINQERCLVGKDVAEVLGYARPTKAIQYHVDDEDKSEIPI